MKQQSVFRVGGIFAVVLAVAVVTSTQRGLAGPQTLSLDDFEASAIRVADATSSDLQSRLLWNQYEGDFTEGPDPGDESISTTTAHSGTRSLKIHVTGGNLYAQFFTHNGQYWKWARDFATGGTWQMNSFNRLRIWLKVPSQVQKEAPGQTNLQIGSYFRASNGDTSSAEAGGDHFYHLYNIPYTGEWHQVIVDSHPNHIRGGGGNTEWGDRLHPTNESNYNYFDLMTRFYIDFQGKLPSFPADFYIDQAEWYADPSTENVKQVYSLNGVYVPSSNKIYVGWSRDKTQDSVRHEVRYSFSDINSVGWAAATAAPSGMITPPDSGGYNAMEYSTTAINVSGHSVVYIGIKPENSSSFRQIAIPTTNTMSGAPAAPTNVRVIS